MTQIPMQFLTLFAGLHLGDELILHKGAGTLTWKFEVLYLVPRGVLMPVPLEVWQPALLPLPDTWQGNIRFYCGDEGTTHWPWVAAVKAGFPVDLDRGTTPILALDP